MSQPGILALSPPSQPSISSMYGPTNPPNIQHGESNHHHHHHSAPGSNSMTPPIHNSSAGVGTDGEISTHLHSHSDSTTSQLSRLIISEADSHCVQAFDRLRVQREQARFTDLILSVQGREFPAHRCVLAACSPWFDSKLKMHKVTREIILVTECKDYEIFYALLTYCYTGHIIIEKGNVAELMHLSTYFGMVKLRSHCCEYLDRNLNMKNVHSVMELSLRYNLEDLRKRSMSVLQRNFAYIFENDRNELLHYPINQITAFLNEKSWALKQELLLKFITRWVGFAINSREGDYIQLLNYINWGNIKDYRYISDHLEKEGLYSHSHEALFSILHVLDRNGIYLGPKFQEIYQGLQDKLLPEQDLDELNDSNSFLSQAINSAVKDLEHSVVDPDWFLQNDPAPPYPTTPSIAGSSNNIGNNVIQQQPQPQSSQVFQKPLPPPPPLAPTSMSSSSSHTTSSNNGNTTNTTVLIPSPFPSPSSILSAGSAGITKQIDKMDNTSNKFVSKDSFDFEIVEQLINEQQQFSDAVDPVEENSIRENNAGPQPSVSDITAENRLQEAGNISLNDPNETLAQDQENMNGSQTSSIIRKNPDCNLKYRDAASSIKRFDPKFRALTEAFRLKNEEDAKAAAIAAGSNIGSTSVVDDANATPSQDSGIMTQESSQDETLNESADEKFYKYMASTTPSSSSGVINQMSPNVRNRPHQCHQTDNSHTINNSGGDMTMGMPATSDLSSPILNNDRYQQSYENSRMVPNADLVRQANHQQILSQWNQINKQGSSEPVPTHTIPPPNYNCYVNQTNSSNGTNRGHNLNIFDGTGTPPPPQQQTMHSPSFMTNCAQQSNLQSDCMQQQSQSMQGIHQNCRVMESNALGSSIERQNNSEHEQLHQLNHQQMIQTPTHHSDVSILPHGESDAKSWPSQIIATPSGQQDNHNEIQNNTEQQNYQELPSKSNSSYPNYQPLIANESPSGLLVPSHHVANNDIKMQSLDESCLATDTEERTIKQNNEFQNAKIQERSDMVCQDISRPASTTYPLDENSRNITDVNADSNTETESHSSANDKEKPSLKLRISTTHIPHSDDHSLDPFFSGKVGKKKLASKHKLYSDRIRKTKGHFHANLAQQSLEIKQFGSMQSSYLPIKPSSAQNQHVKKAKLLASSEHRKQVEHKNHIVKIIAKSDEKSKEPQKIEPEHFFSDRQYYKESNEKSQSHSASVPTSFKSEEDVTRERQDINPEASTADEFNGINEVDSNSQIDNEEISFTIEDECSSGTPINSVETTLENEEKVANSFDNPVMKPPHKKRNHPIDPDSGSNTMSKDGSEIDTHRLKMISCEKRPYETASMSKTMQHVKEHCDVDKSKQGQFVPVASKTEEITSCPYCETFSTSLKKELRIHINSLHGPCPPYKCNTKSCAYASKKLYLLLMHLQTHSNEFKFKCTLDGCTFAATTVHKLKFHKSTAHSPNKQFRCVDCQKEFTTKASLQAHSEVVHAPENQPKLLKCDRPGCDFTTKWANHLRTHNKIHSGDVYRCSALEGCKYSTPKMSLLKAHERAHRGERNFKCNQCSCAFVEKSHLTRHQKSVHSTEDEKPFACTETKSGCSFKTKRRDKLKDHLARIHGITQVPDNKGLKPSILKNSKNAKKGGKKSSVPATCDKA